MTVLMDTAGPLSSRSFFWLYTLVPAALILQQLLLAPASTYTRTGGSDSKPVITAEEAEDPSLNIVAASQPSSRPALGRNSLSAGPGGPATQDSDIVSSGFSRVSYPWHAETWPEEADEDDEVKVLDGGKGDPVVGRMFGRSVGEQVRSGWFW